MGRHWVGTGFTVGRRVARGGSGPTRRIWSRRCNVFVVSWRGRHLFELAMAAEARNLGRSGVEVVAAVQAGQFGRAAQMEVAVGVVAMVVVGRSGRWEGW